MSSWADPEGETGKSQVIWVSIGNKQLDTTPLFWKKLSPPENVGPPLEPWKRIDNIPAGPEPPPPPPPEENSWIRAWSSDDQLMFIAAVKKGVIPVAHVYALHREIPPSLRGESEDHARMQEFSSGGIQVHLT